MRSIALVSLVALCLAAPAMAQIPSVQSPNISPRAPPAPRASSLVDYDGFTNLASQLGPTRAQRMISLEQFNAMAREQDTLVLDARSPAAFQAGHIRGAINLPLTDFTADSLAQVIGNNRNRRILIYCNNNFTDNVYPIMMKMVQLALNIQTFINLHGYGYTNVYELRDAVTTHDPAVGWIRG